MENSIDKKTQINFWYVIIALVGILFVQSQYEKYSKVEPIPYSRFQALLEQGAIVEIAVTHDYIYGKFRGLDLMRGRTLSQQEWSLNLPTSLIGITSPIQG